MDKNVMSSIRRKCAHLPHDRNLMYEPNIRHVPPTEKIDLCKKTLTTSTCSSSKCARYEYHIMPSLLPILTLGKVPLDEIKWNN